MGDEALPVVLVVYPNGLWTTMLPTLGLPYEFKVMDSAAAEQELSNGGLVSSAIVFHSDRIAGADNVPLLAELNSRNIPTILISPDQDTVDRLTASIPIAAAGFAQPFTMSEILDTLNKLLPPR